MVQYQENPGRHHEERCQDDKPPDQQAHQVLEAGSNGSCGEPGVEGQRKKRGKGRPMSSAGITAMLFASICGSVGRS